MGQWQVPSMEIHHSVPVQEGGGTDSRAVSATWSPGSQVCLVPAYHCHLSDAEPLWVRMKVITQQAPLPSENLASEWYQILLYTCLVLNNHRFNHFCKIGCIPMGGHLFERMWFTQNFRPTVAVDFSKLEFLDIRVMLPLRLLHQWESWKLDPSVYPHLLIGPATSRMNPTPPNWHYREAF